MKKKNGFTMIEMVVVVVIIAVLAAIATPMYFNYVKQSQITSAETQIKLLDETLRLYKMDMGKYPSAEEGLNALVKNPNNNKRWKGPYLRGGTVPLDPWGNAFVYKFPGEHGEFDLICYGADGVPGGDDDNADLTNWNKE